MEDLDNLYELFDQYFFNTLDETEKKAFEQRLSENAEFKEEYELYLDLVAGIKLASEDHLRQKLMDTDNTILPVKTSSFPRYLYLVAAAVAILIISSLIVVWITQKSSLTDEKMITKEQDKDAVPPDKQEKIIDKKEGQEKPEQKPGSDKTMNDEKYLAVNYYKEYYESYPNNLIPKSRGGIPEELLPRAMYYYDQKDFVASSEILATLYNSEPNNPDYLFYYAICQMELYNFKDAEKLFKKLLDSGNTKYQFQSMWYLSLAYIENKNFKAAGKLLEELAGTQNPYKDKAQSLLNEISQSNK